MVTCFGVTTIVLAVLFPIKKHKFTYVDTIYVHPQKYVHRRRFNCLSHEELTTLELLAIEKGVPLGAKFVCEFEENQCSGARVLSGSELLAYCDGASKCIDVTTQAAHESALDWAAAHDHASAVEGAIARYCAAHPSQQWCKKVENVTAACVASSVCDAAQDFWMHPEQFCGDSAAKHVKQCQTAMGLVEVAEREFADLCNTTNVSTKVACNLVNTSLHNRGYYNDVCKKNPATRALCKGLFDKVKAVVDEEFCDINQKNRALCSAIYAIGERWSNASANLPILDFAVTAVEIYCANGICSSASGLRPLKRVEEGWVAREINLTENRLPSICGSWPIVESYCANATETLIEFCQDHSLACQWLGQLMHFNSSTAKNLFISTWQDAAALCSDTDPSYPVTTEVTVPFFADGLSLASLKGLACEAKNAIDIVAGDCPTMIPLVYDADQTTAQIDMQHRLNGQRNGDFLQPRPKLRR